MLVGPDLQHRFPFIISPPQIRIIARFEGCRPNSQGQGFADPNSPDPFLMIFFFVSLSITALRHPLLFNFRLGKELV